MSEYRTPIYCPKCNAYIGHLIGDEAAFAGVCHNPTCQTPLMARHLQHRTQVKALSRVRVERCLTTVPAVV